MKYNDFYIGMKFKCGNNYWKVTDIGSRVIVAVGPSDKTALSWPAGPPYSREEIVFDDYDFPGCHKIEVGELNDSK